ncbi:translation initiation factor IF-2-like [Phodopus roborovskii]|uniref:translation initiation factor IF-2-like n=1 Tax=Phodopus roborovskii TaxID=109678 RepID=UPI0021E4BDFF|nr:translation initiation factor IF-2-like [Phodopus roborovskii]
MASLEFLEIHLSMPPECWGFSHGPGFTGLRSRSKPGCDLGKRHTQPGVRERVPGWGVCSDPSALASGSGTVEQRPGSRVPGMWEGWAGREGALPLAAGGETLERAPGPPPPTPRPPPARWGRGPRRKGGEGPRSTAVAWPARPGGSDEYSEGEGRRGGRALGAAPCSRSRMTRGGGRGSSRGRGSREPGATRGGWASLAPPREAPACLGPRPLRAKRARLRRVAAAAAAAMSPGKPGAGGAGTRRTGWRRRRRRRWPEAETREPGFGHTAGRVPGTFQGAQGMKPAALETRSPPRSPGLRWALLPLLLLLRLGQVLCTGAVEIK